MKRLRLPLVLLFAATSGACASASVSIRHDDPTVARAAIEIDGQPRGTVGYGAEKELDVSEGRHRIRLTADGTGVSPWSDDGGWVVVVEDELCIVLHADRGDEPTVSEQHRPRPAQPADDDRAGPGQKRR